MQLPPTAVFIIIEPVDGADAGRLLVGVLLVRRYRLRLTNMLVAHDWVNIYDTRCKTLVALFDQRGEPYFIRSDNGPKFVAKAVKRRLEATGVETLYIEPGSPWENTYAETFIGRFGDELLKREVFANLLEAKVLVEEYRNHYNRERPHSALAYLPPAEFTPASKTETAFEKRSP